MLKKNIKRYHISLYIIFTIILIFFSYLIGINFENLRKSIYKDSDIKFYRDICEETFPIFRIAFNNGNFKFSIINEFRGFIIELYDIDFYLATSLLKSELHIFTLYENERQQKNIMDNLASQSNEDGENYKINQSSVFYENEFDTKESTSEKYENIIFNKDGNFQLGLSDIFGKQKKITFDKKGPKVLIYHTHSTEGYNISNKAPSNSKLTGNALKKVSFDNTVVGVGEIIASELRNKYKIDVIHNATEHDKTTKTGAYARSLETATNILNSYSSIKVILDIHRDGISDTQKFRPTIKVSNKSVAKVMFVVGTNISGLTHPKWKENLKFAIELQRKLEQICPGITRPIYVSKNRYNEHLSDNSLIIEVGGDGNTKEESHESARYVAKALNEVINSK